MAKKKAAKTVAPSSRARTSDHGRGRPKDQANAGTESESLGAKKLSGDKEKSQEKTPSKNDPQVRVVAAEIVEPSELVEPAPEELEEAATELDLTGEPEIVIPDSDSRSLTTTDPVAAYLASIRKYPLLTREQEHELAVRFRESGDAKAAEMLVTANLRFVVKVAAEYSKFGARLIDLIQEGNVGLMHAVRDFNPYKGVRLITYAVWWIRGYIQEYLMRQYSLVRIGTTQNQRKLFYRLQKEKEQLDAMGKNADIKLLSARLGVSEEEIEVMRKRLSGRDVSLSQPLGDDSRGTLLDYEESNDERVDDAIEHREELNLLHENIEGLREQLNEKELYVLEHRILSDEPMTLQEIGDHYKVTREAVRQMEARLLEKIKKAYLSASER